MQKLVKVVRYYHIDMDTIENRYDEPEDAERANIIAEEIAQHYFEVEFLGGKIDVDSFSVEYVKDVE